MSSSIIDPRFRITIPREIREGYGLKVGDKITFFKKGKQIVLIKVPKDPLLAMKGSLHIDADAREFLRELKEEDLRDEEYEGRT